MLEERKITHILTVSKHINPKFPDKFEYQCIEVDDMPSENLSVHFLKGIKFIKSALDKGGRVLVHCAAGISRSSTIVCAYLMQQNSWTFDKAWAYGQSKRAKMYPNSGFQSQLRIFEGQIFNKESNSI